MYSISPTAARALIILVRLYEASGDWVQTKAVSAAHSGVRTEAMLACTGDGLTKLRLWKLIEPKPNTHDPTKKSLGLYRPTAAGIAFAHDRLRVPKYANVYGNKLLRLDASETVGIRDALRNKFDYMALMARVGTAPADLEREQ